MTSPMVNPILNALLFSVLCPECRKNTMIRVIELISNVEIVCGFCKHKINIRTEQWRSFIDELRESVEAIRHLPPQSE